MKVGSCMDSIRALEKNVIFFLGLCVNFHVVLKAGMPSIHFRVYYLLQIGRKMMS